MSKQEELIPAAMYVRKSTKGLDSDGGERQERSIPDQTSEIEKLARSEVCKILRRYADEGIRGWKRGADRPGFAQMLADAQRFGDFKVIIVDDVDRFTRASWRKAVVDVQALADAGVEKIISARDGTFNIVDEDDAGEAHRLVAIAMANHNFSRKLASRELRGQVSRVSKEGKRSGGRAPYGTIGVRDGRGKIASLTPSTTRVSTVSGSKTEHAVLLRIFKRLVVSKHCPNQIAADLNRDGIPSPRGKRWYSSKIRDILKNPAYRGDLTFGRRQQGTFFVLGKDGTTILDAKKGKMKRQYKLGEPAIRIEKAWPPIVPVKLWDAAQKRLAEITERRFRGPNRVGDPVFPLFGVLYCDHCGMKLNGCRPGSYKEGTKRNYRIYTHGGDAGHARCPSGGTPSIREDRILPIVLRMLGEEIADLGQVVPSPPEELVEPGRGRRKGRDGVIAERDSLKQKIERAAEYVLDAPDAATAKIIYAKIAKLREELKRLDAELEVDREPDYRQEDWEALNAHWNEFESKALSMPISPDANIAFVGGLMQDPMSDESAILVDPLLVREFLATIGAELRLRWKTTPKKSKNHYEWLGGRFRLGQKTGRISAMGEVKLSTSSPTARSHFRPFGAASLEERGRQSRRASRAMPFFASRTASIRSWSWQDQTKPSAGW